MKVNIEVEMTPEEARELLGLPNIGKYQETLVKALGSQLQNGSSEMVNSVMRPLFEESQRAFKTYQSLLEAFVGQARPHKKTKD